MATLSSRLPTLKIDPKSVQVLQSAAEKPFYATVGVTDLAVEAVREYVADVQGRVRGYSKDVQSVQPRALRDSAVTAVSKLQGEARTVPARVQNLVDDNVALVEGAYGDLVKRGETLVGRIRRQQSTKDTVKAAGTTAAKAKTTRTQTTKAAKATSKATAKKATTTAKKRSTAPRSSAKATATAAKKTAAAATQATSDAAAKVGD